MYPEEKRLSIIWLILIVVTLFSWEAGMIDSDKMPLTLIALIMFLSFLKVWLVGMEFMEIRHAPKPLKVALDGWMVVTCVTLITGLHFPLT